MSENITTRNNKGYFHSYVKKSLIFTSAIRVLLGIFTSKLLVSIPQKSSLSPIRPLVLRSFIATFFLLFLFTEFITAQSSDRLAPVPNVYLDCGSCDVNYIRTNIAFVNYVRDQDDADIYLHITDQRTGGGGREYTLVFRGLGDFSSRRDTLRYSSSSTDSGDERRIGLNRHIKIGLVPFVTQTVAVRNLDIFYETPETDGEDEDEIDDPWDNWVFDVNISSNVNGVESETNFGFYSGVEAERITDQWKFIVRSRGEIRRRTLELSDRTLDINRDWGDTWGMLAYSLADQVSVGMYGRARFSRTENIALDTYLAPAIEYNFFPYGEFQERRFIVQYQLTPSYRRYYNTTINFVDSEWIMRQEFMTQFRFDQPWGRIDVRLSGLNYFHDTSINRLEINPSFNIRIIRGLSVSLSGRYRIINDQLSLELPDDADPNDSDDILKGVQRPTSYNYSVSFGLSYTFGSIYNNVVNPRL